MLSTEGAWSLGWPAVEAVATGIAALGAVVALIFARAAAMSTKATLEAQAQQLAIDSERWREERAERLRLARLDAAKLQIESALADGGGVQLTITNSSDAPFVHLVVDADPDHPGQGDAPFAFLISMLGAGESQDVAVPPGVWWRVSYFDVGWRKWVLVPESDGMPVRLDPPEV